MTIRTLLAAGALLTCLPVAALAADPAIPTSPAAPQEPGRWYIQAGPAGIVFDESTSLTAAGSPVPGAEVKLSEEMALAVGLGYFLTPNFSLIGLVGTPPESKIEGAGTLLGLEPGAVRYGPAILAANYHFRQFGAFQPFVGAGATYVAILDETSRDIANLQAENAVGAVLRAGFDYMLDERRGLFFSVQKLFVDTKVTGSVSPSIPGFGGAPVEAKIDLDPLILHGGFTYRF